MSREGGGGYYIPPSQDQYGIDPLTPPPSGGGTSGYPAIGPCDFVKQLQCKIASLETQLMCSHAETETLHLELYKRTKALDDINEKYAQLVEDQHFAQKCVKLEAKIATNKAISEDKEKIKELQEIVGKLEEDKKGLEGDKKVLEEVVQKQGTKLEIQRDLNTRLHGMFKKISKAATENVKDMESFLVGLNEEGVKTVVDSATPMDEIEGTDMVNALSALCVESLPPSPRSSLLSNDLDSDIRYSSGSSADGRGRGGGRLCRDYFDPDDQQQTISSPPPAAFLDAINSLTLEDLEELERMEMGLDKESNTNK